MTAFNFIGALEAGQSRALAMASSRPLVVNGFPDARVCAYIIEAVINGIQHDKGMKWRRGITGTGRYSSHYVKCQYEASGHDPAPLHPFAGRCLQFVNFEFNSF
jgi:hypothetical protein